MARWRVVVRHGRGVAHGVLLLRRGRSAIVLLLVVVVLVVRWLLLDMLAGLLASRLGGVVGHGRRGGRWAG